MLRRIPQPGGGSGGSPGPCSWLNVPQVLKPARNKDVRGLKGAIPVVGGYFEDILDLFLGQ